MIEEKELPKGWMLKRIREICEINPKISLDQIEDSVEVSFVPMKNVEEETGKIDSGEKKAIASVKKGYTPFSNEDIIFSKITPCMENGKIAIADKLENGIGFGSTEFIVLRTSVGVINKFLFYFLIQKSFRHLAASNMTGAVGQRRVPKSFIENALIPIAPLDQQRQIVARIEELFSDLDKGIESLKTAQQQLKTCRQAVLKYAFEGRFTNTNIKEGELPEGWKSVKISDICNVVRGGSPRPAGDPKYYNGDIPFLKVADLTKDTNPYVRSFSYTIKEAGLHKTRKISPNTLLLTNSGATLGVPKICMIDATMNDGVAALLDLDPRSNLFLYYILLTKTKSLRNINQGAAQPNLNTQIIKEINIPYCSFEEQSQIVKEIEDRLSACDKVEETIEASLQQSESLRQSILKKAFEGKLV